jgi:hypothetical protein
MLAKVRPPFDIYVSNVKILEVILVVDHTSSLIMLTICRDKFEIKVYRISAFELCNDLCLKC